MMMDKLDTIILTFDDYEKLFQWRDNHKEYVRDFKPVLNEGVIVIGGYHVQRFADEAGIVTHDVYYAQSMYSKEPIHRHKLIWNKDTGIGHQVFSEVFGIEDMQDYNASIISLHTSLMAYMEYYGDKKEYVQVETVTRKTGGSTPRKRGRSKRKKATIKIQKETKVKQYLINVTEESVTRDTRRYERHTDRWTVRGHWRTTKLGKRVWVKPHVRGEEEKDVTPKEYRL